jgi:hypothetical protein
MQWRNEVMGGAWLGTVAKARSDTAQRWLRIAGNLRGAKLRDVPHGGLSIRNNSSYPVGIA